MRGFIGLIVTLCVLNEVIRVYQFAFGISQQSTPGGEVFGFVSNIMIAMWGLYLLARPSPERSEE
jgi:hypothetical protein